MLDTVAIPQEVALSQPTTRRTSPFFASRPRGPLIYLYHLWTFAAAYSRNLGMFSRSWDIVPSGIVRMAPSDADVRKESPLLGFSIVSRILYLDGSISRGGVIIFRFL